MQTLTSAELAFLAMLGHQELTVKVLRLYAQRRYLFSGTLTRHLDLMWNAYTGLLVKSRGEGGVRVTPDLVSAALTEALQGSSMLPAELKAKCDDMLQRYLSGNVPDLETGTRLIKSLTERDGNRKLLSKINGNAGLQELIRTLDATRRTLDDLEPSDQPDDTGIVFNPLRDIGKLARHVVRVPTGINWLDDVSSGGGRAGELWLILGPPGGGKSVIAVQYSCAQAMNGNNTLWVTYEQSLEGDLAERMIANITDTSLDEIRDVGFDRLPKQVQDRFWASVAGVDDRLTALDMTKMKPSPDDPEDYGGIRTIWNEFNKLKQAGRAPKTVIIDWFGSMMSRIASNTGLDLSACYRFKAQEEINLALQFARQENIMLIFFHQVDAKAADARPTFLANATHAQDMHNMQNFFDLVFLIGTRDINDICYFSSGKSRKGCKVVRTLHLIGDKSRFRMEDGWLPNRDGNFYKPGKTGGSEMDGVASGYARELD